MVRGEFPFMGVIGFTRRGDSSIEWKCGANLISRTFALTASHCIQNGIKWLRLGVVSKINA